MGRVEAFEQKDILGYRGERVVCQDCRAEGEKTLWLVLYEFKRKPKTRIPKEEQEKINQICYRHIMNYPNHHINIIDMKA